MITVDIGENATPGEYVSTIDSVEFGRISAQMAKKQGQKFVRLRETGLRIQDRR